MSSATIDPIFFCNELIIIFVFKSTQKVYIKVIWYLMGQEYRENQLTAKVAR